MPETINQYIFGNSLVNFAGGSEQSNLPYWIDLFAEWAGNTYTVNGGYGFLRDFADRESPANQWGFDGVDGLWDSDAQTFSQVSFDSVLIAPANFIQYQSPDAEYPGDVRSPLDAALDVIDDVVIAQPTAEILIYEGWAELQPFMSGPSVNDADLDAYHAHMQSDYHEWYVSLVSQINAADPDADVTLLPVASILSDIMMLPEFADLPADTFFVDDAPHGTETTYFLASMVGYSSLYGEPVPADFPVPDSIDPTVAEYFAMLSDFVYASIAEPGADEDMPVPPVEDDTETPPEDIGEDTNDQTDPESPTAPEPEDDTDAPVAPDVPEQDSVDDGRENAGEMPDPSTPDQFHAAYFAMPENTQGLAGVDFSAPADATAMVDAPNFCEDTGPAWEGGASDHFAAIYSRDLSLEYARDYRFELYADDEAALYVDGALVLSTQGAELETLMTADIRLDAGAHHIELQYFENEGEQTLVFDMVEIEADTGADLPGGEDLMELLAIAPPHEIQEEYGTQAENAQCDEWEGAAC